MNYLVLPENLHSTADIVYNYLSNDMGLPKVQIESSMDQRIEYRPTFYTITRDFYFHCVDVSEKIYNPTRWLFISDCEHKGRPVKFYVALPSIDYTGFPSEMKRAKEAGIGILEASIQTQQCQSISSALSLSLFGLRNFDKAAFPKKYREVVTTAEDCFRNGEPNKACSTIYDEIESLTRKIVFQAHKKGFFKKPITNPNKLIEKIPWATVLLHLRDDIDRITPSPYSVIPEALISQLHGTTSCRNQSGHKPISVPTLIKRDSQLRTRMEAAVDLLCEIAAVTKPLRIL